MKRMLTRLRRYLLDGALMSCMGVMPWMSHVKAQQIKKKESVPADEISRRMQSGLHQPGAQSKVSNHAFKYIKCPTKTVNGWEHHAICAICLKNDISNATVKLRSNDSTTPLVEHFMVHHKEV